MNRRWPTTASWTLAALTLAVAVADLIVGGLTTGVHGLAAGAALAQLCIRRHLQQGLPAGLVLFATLAVCFYPVKFRVFAPVDLGAFALLVGSRGIAGSWLRNRPGAKGYRVLALSSAVFGLSAGLLLQVSADGLSPVKPTAALFRMLIAILVGALAQLLATPGLVKVIPGRLEDEQPAVALWLLLIAWLAVRIGAAV
ncbi:MAG TPA: hypothetical protein VI454_12540 [Verrucomicrobiae bacterium]|jgi:hypothetical protein